MSTSPTARYQSRVDELESLRSELEAPKRAGDPAPVVALVLEAAGDVLRRSKAVKFDAVALDATLKAISREALASWGAAVSVAAVQHKLHRAADEAVEAAVPDANGDATVIANFAMQDLMQRDRLESALTALKKLAMQGRSDAQQLQQKLQNEVQQADAKSKKAVAGLTALNSERRAESAVLDPECRSAAWWLTSRAGLEDDALVKIFAGETRGALGDLERAVSDTVTEPRTRTICFEELLRYDLGNASPAEKAAIQAQASRDAEMKLVLAAMTAGDEAIEEEMNGAAAKAPQVNRVERAAEQTAPEIVNETEDFKVLIFRARQVTVLVQPVRPDRFAAAAVVISNRPNVELPGHAVAQGLEFELGTAAAVSGRSARVTVRLKSGATVHTEIAL